VVVLALVPASAFPFAFVVAFALASPTLARTSASMLAADAGVCVEPSLEPAGPAGAGDDPERHATIVIARPTIRTTRMRSVTL
jgi:hypothetical protein